MRPPYIHCPSVFLRHKKGQDIFFSPLNVVAENIYEKRPRRKMVKDPVTGKINFNPKQQSKPAIKRAEKVSKPNTFLDLRPLDNFESKFVAKKRLSVLSFLLETDW